MWSSHAACVIYPFSDNLKVIKSVNLCRIINVIGCLRSINPLINIQAIQPSWFWFLFRLTFKSNGLDWFLPLSLENLQLPWPIGNMFLCQSSYFVVFGILLLINTYYILNHYTTYHQQLSFHNSVSICQYLYQASLKFELALLKSSIKNYLLLENYLKQFKLSLECLNHEIPISDGKSAPVEFSSCLKMVKMHNWISPQSKFQHGWASEFIIKPKQLSPK